MATNLTPGIAAEFYAARETTTSCDVLDLKYAEPPSAWWLSVVIFVIGSVLYASYYCQNFHKNKARISERVKATLARKHDFIARAGDENYGYRGTPRGFIDDWRPREIPNLILPYPEAAQNDDRSDEREVYLDYAGAALPTRTQLEQIHRSTVQSILANPHSTGPAASRTSLLMNQTKKRVLEFFHATPGRYAGLSHPPSGCSAADCHPGYELVFTSGATESLRIVAERFPWSNCSHCGRSSVLLYPQNAHTSVVGMRGPALSQGGTFRCEPLQKICAMDEDNFTALGQGTTNDTGECNHCRGKIHNLLVIPAECNFGGDRPHVKTVVAAANGSTAQFSTMLDVAKAACTSPLHFRELNPDFACLSFYKMFGLPTGLGVLFVKRSSVHLLTGNNAGSSSSSRQQPGSYRYFGGGSIDLVLPRKDFCVPRSAPTSLACLSNGTQHFRGIVALAHGFDELDRLGGMHRIRQHTVSLAADLARRLQSLRHANGKAAVVLYGSWGKQIQKHDMPGPTIALNVLRQDGSFVGYNEVSKLAALNHPPIQFRTGCFCNPGACQEALELSDDDIIENFETDGHVCGDHIDLINDRPTGAIRVSIGKESIWEDCDAFVAFLENFFVAKTMPTKEEPLNDISDPTQVTVSALYLFPIKSCAAQHVKRWKMNFPSGKLAFDREFALVDVSGSAMRLQNCPKMGLIRPSVNLEKRTLTVSAPGCEDLILDLEDCDLQDGASDIVKVCGNRCGGKVWGDHSTSNWFSSFLGVQCWLARHVDGDYRLSALSQANDSSLDRNPRVAFANEQPLLLVTENAVATLNSVLEEQNQRPVISRQFRPNVVVKSPVKAWLHAEDEWSTLSVIGKDLSFNVMGNCARCAMVDFAPDGKKGKTLRALAKYRRQNGRIDFGIFLQGVHQRLVDQEVWLEEGDVILCVSDKNI
jgi:molybdenum cofactor sulfurtransferase